MGSGDAPHAPQRTAPGGGAGADSHADRAGCDGRDRVFAHSRDTDAPTAATTWRSCAPLWTRPRPASSLTKRCRRRPSTCCSRPSSSNPPGPTSPDPADQQCQGHGGLVAVRAGDGYRGQHHGPGAPAHAGHLAQYGRCRRCNPAAASTNCGSCTPRNTGISRHKRRCLPSCKRVTRRCTTSTRRWSSRSPPRRPPSRRKWPSASGWNATPSGSQHFALLGRLAGGLSHEIRNPLGVVVLQVDLLEEELRQPSPDSATEMALALTEIKTHLTRVDDLSRIISPSYAVGAVQQVPWI